MLLTYLIIEINMIAPFFNDGTANHISNDSTAAGPPTWVIFQTIEKWNVMIG
jgi:hypothetical protein